jgi:hypothetical protein
MAPVGSLYSYGVALEFDEPGAAVRRRNSTSPGRPFPGTCLFPHPVTGPSIHASLKRNIPSWRYQKANALEIKKD